jgi:hypothetical protein
MSDDIKRPVASAGSVGEVLAKGIADIIRIATEPDWIPVTERLPDEDRLVLVFDPELADLGLATYTKSDGWLGECVALYEPTHWMPLPAPPTDRK